MMISLSERPRSLRRYFLFVLAFPLLSVGLISGCATPALKDDPVEMPPTFAQPPADHGPLADIATGIFDANGDDHSGFRLLDSSYDGLAWRLALIDSAVSSVDIQTYLWYPDHSGRLVLSRAVLAAKRGVHVRLIIDDLMTIGQDHFFADLEGLPNVEIRLFNPWKSRGTAARAAEMIAEMERLNSRMHDKLVIVDGVAIVIGGRNIGDHYFGLSDAYNFHDLDLLGIGHIARQANDMFDHFWNSGMVVSAQNLTTKPDKERAQEAWDAMLEKIDAAPEVEKFQRRPADWSAQLSALLPELRVGTSTLIFDETQDNEISQTMGANMFALFDRAQHELLITNAYVIPAQRGIDFVQGLTDRGVDVRILTNSLASHDVPAVNSHYKEWRDDFINAGVELFEFRADSEIKSIVEVPPVEGEFTGLHTKATVIDRRLSFVGSMNLDPRSGNINTEMGAIVDSPELGEDLALLMLRDMSPANAWQVHLDDDGNPYWVNSDEMVHEQPARSGSQRIMDVIFKVVPKEQN